MSPQLRCCSHICVILMIFGGIAKAESNVKDDMTKWKEHEIDVFVLKEIVEDLQHDLEDLLKSSKAQSRMLENIRSEKQSDLCENVENAYNKTQRKYNYVQERIVVKIDEIQAEQMENLKKIKDRKSNCQSSPSTAAVLPPTMFGEISGQIELLETQLQDHETHQKAQHTKNEEQLKILRDINTKLTAHQEKFEKLEKELTELLKPQPKQGYDVVPEPLPMSLVVGMAKKNADVK
uniref:Uncharacterized protein n=1 Tax=Stomoxys calcitrans TaxID=35570 RepID=A0A1I8PH12_STOCA